MIKISVLWFGSKGALVVNESRPEVAVYHREQVKGPYNRRVASEGDFLMVESFARAIDTGGPTPLDARAGRAIAATVEAAIESGRTGNPVAVR